MQKFLLSTKCISCTAISKSGITASYFFENKMRDSNGEYKAPRESVKKVLAIICSIFLLN